MTISQIRTLPADRVSRRIAHASEEELAGVIYGLNESSDRGQCELATAFPYNHARPRVSLTPGSRIGPYEIGAQIGVGGMGEVYRALDTNLGRQVAIKILPDTFAHDPERLARFEREAKALAALNHPNIAQIYGFEKTEGIRALAMELVEGGTLADRIARGRIPIDEALSIATQIAEALEAAHEQGVIHRDLKPSNIKVRPDGTVKVLDFGLAKAMEPAVAGSTDATASPTITSPALMTGAGVFLGTAAYMSPEQARGTASDKRCDIWAFGIVLFEMLSGKRPFEGETLSDTLAAVLRVQPDWTRLPLETPPRLRLVLRRCLEKDRRLRLRDIGDARVELLETHGTTVSDSFSATNEAPAMPRLSGLFGGGFLLVAGAALALAGVFAWSRNNTVQARPEVRRFLITKAIGADIDALTNAAVSPDGQRIALTARVGGNRGVFIHSLRDGTTSEIPGTLSNSLMRPVWSPDGAWLALNIGTELRRVALDGRSQTLGPLGAFQGASWAPSGEILSASNLQILGVSSTTGEQRLILDVDSDRLAWGSPHVLPGGKLFLTQKVYAAKETLYVANIDGSTQPTAIAASGSNPVFVAPDHLLVVREGQLIHWRFDPAEASLIGDPVILMGGLRAMSGTNTVPFSVSDTGVLVAFEERHSMGTSLSWFDRKGTQMESLALSRPCRNPELSPDGKRVAMECYEVSGNRDIWLYDLERHTAQRLTTSPSDDADPLWSPDGSRIVFASTELGAADVFVKTAGGATKETLMLQTEGGTPTMSWSPDGKHIAVLLPGLGFATFDPAAPGVLTRFQGEFSIGYYEPQFAPNGRFVSYGSTETGRAEVFAQPWPPTGEKFLVSVGGGTDARWSPAGNEIFYVGLDRKLMSVPVNIAGKKLEPGTPVPLFQTRIAGPLGVGQRFPYAVSRDGQRFLMYVEETGTTPAITVILNWPSLLPH